MLLGHGHDVCTHTHTHTSRLLTVISLQIIGPQYTHTNTHYHNTHTNTHYHNTHTHITIAYRDKLRYHRVVIDRNLAALSNSSVYAHSVILVGRLWREHIAAELANGGKEVPQWIFRVDTCLDGPALGLDVRLCEWQSVCVCIVYVCMCLDEMRRASMAQPLGLMSACVNGSLCVCLMRMYLDMTRRAYACAHNCSAVELV
jgi:hypothetical protein